MISAISNAGTMGFMLYEEKMTVQVFLKFLERLIHGQKKKIFLIMDNLKVHHALQGQEDVKMDQARFVLAAHIEEVSLLTLKNLRCFALTMQKFLGS